MSVGNILTILIGTMLQVAISNMAHPYCCTFKLCYNQLKQLFFFFFVVLYVETCENNIHNYWTNSNFHNFPSNVFLFQFILLFFFGEMFSYVWVCVCVWICFSAKLIFHIFPSNLKAFLVEQTKEDCINVCCK